MRRGNFHQKSEDCTARRERHADQLAAVRLLSGDDDPKETCRGWTRTRGPLFRVPSVVTAVGIWDQCESE